MPTCPACRGECKRTATRKGGVDCLKCDHCSTVLFTSEYDQKLDRLKRKESFFSNENLETAIKMQGGEKIPYACKCPSCDKLMLVTKKCKKLRPIFHVRCLYCKMNGFVSPAFWANMFEE